MALQGNPFLGKLKIPAPDLSRIPETPFESKSSNLETPLPLIVTAPKEEQHKDAGTNHIATPNKRVANGYQTDSKEVAKRVANGYQTDSKEVAASSIHHHPLSEEKLKQVAQRVAEQIANGEQTGSKEVASATFETLVGKERGLLLFIIEDCQLNGDLKTAPLTLERISEALVCSSNRSKNVIQRLIEKSFIHRAEAKTGRGGWTRFGVSKEIFQKVLLRETGSKGVANGHQSGSKEVANQVAQRVAGGPSSSSVLIKEDFKTTTTGESELLETTGTQLTPEWLTVDYSDLSEIGFTQTHLVQIIRQGKLQPAEVQDSIYYFAFDLKRNEKGKNLNGPPINFFMGILRRGGPYTPPDNYESSADEARRKTREFKERKERERQDEDQKLMTLEFAEWRRGLSAAEIIGLLPEHARKPGQVQESVLKIHFEENVWPERAQELLGMTKLDRDEVSRQIDQSLGEKL
ncbi:hypothetical protein WDW86_19705 [Bdellovibrionota bacterium FG-2]